MGRRKGEDATGGRQAVREAAEARIRAVAEQCRAAPPTWRFTEGKRTHIWDLTTNEWRELK